MEGTTLSVTDTAGPLDVSRVFVLSGVPDQVSGSRDGLGSPDGSKAYCGKMRSRGAAAPNNAGRMKKGCRGSHRGDN
jgi:hypothetical protein